MISERGQSIVLLAFAFVALLVFAGLAVDAGVIYVGSLHLSRAVDAAALAGVVELSRDDLRFPSIPFARRTALADEKALGFLWANGITYTVDVPLPQFFQSRREAGVIGSYRYQITATHQVDLYFLPLVNFRFVRLRDTAMAEYNPWVDIYTSQGAMTSVNQAFKGRGEETQRGDAFSPAYSNPWYQELEGKYVYRIYVPNEYPHDTMRVEILDPDDYDDEPYPVRVQVSAVFDDGHGGAMWDTRTIPCVGSSCRGAGLLIPSIWFLGMDEGGHQNPLRFALFYYRKLDDGTVARVDIADYVSVAGAPGAVTDMKWTCPTGFEVQDPLHLPQIYRDTDGVYLYLEVTSVGQHTENAFELWAGPLDSDAPVNANERSLYAYVRSSTPVLPTGGVVVYAVGHMAFNSNAVNRIEMDLTDIPAAWAGRSVRVEYFDVDTGTQPPFIFYFDTIPQKNWNRCYDDTGYCDTPAGRERCESTAGGECSDIKRFGYTCSDFGASPFAREGKAWLVDRYDLAKGECGYDDSNDPTSNNRWRVYGFTLPPRGTFYGGRLKVSYGGGNTDNVTMRLMVESAPRLIE